MSYAQPPQFVPGGVDDEALERLNRDQRRENLADRRIELVDRYNRLLNLIAAQQGMSAGDRKKTNLPALSATKLRSTRDLLASSLLLGKLRNRGTSAGQLERIAEQLNQAQTDIEVAEKLWLKRQAFSQSAAESKLESACRSKLGDAAHPLQSQTEIQLRDLIAACEIKPGQAVDGIIVTHEGRKELPIAKPAAQKISYQPVRALGIQPPLPPKTTPVEKTAEPPARPEPKLAKLAPKQVPLDKEDQAKLSILPRVPGMKFVAPPSHTELLAGALGMLKAYDPAQDSLAQIKPHLDEFLLAAEAPKDTTFNSMYEYSYGLARWNQSIERFREAKPSLEQALGFSRDEYWKDYHRDAARLTDFMNGRGGNCEAQTSMIFSLIDRLDLKLPPGHRLLAQTFSGHIQPVIYDEQKDEVLSLVTGKRVKGTSVDLYDPMILVNGWVKSQNPMLARDDKDFIRIKANRKADAKMLVKNAGPGGAKTNSNLALPGADVRFQLEEVPEYATMGAPRLDSVVSADDSPLSWGRNSGNPGHKFGGGKGGRDTSDDSYTGSTLKLPTADGRTAKVNISINPYRTESTECILNNARGPNQGLCSSIWFANPDDYEKATRIKSYEELWRFSLSREIQSQILLPDYQRNKKELLAFMQSPLSAEPPKWSRWGAFETTQFWTGGQPQQKAEARRLLLEADPELAKVFAHLETYGARTRSQPYLFAKRWLETKPHPDAFDSVGDAVQSYERYLGKNPKVRIGYYAPILDDEHAVWTEEDLKERNSHRPKEKKAKSKTSKAREAASFALEMPDTETIMPQDETNPATSPWQDPRPQKPKFPPPPPQPVFIPKDPIKVLETDRILKALIETAATLTPEQREGVKKLWTPAFSKKLENLLSGAAFDNRHELAKAFPESSRCEIYIDGRKPCVPREIAAATLNYLKLMQMVNKANSITGHMYDLSIAGADIALSRPELIEFIDAQLSGRPVRSDLAPILQKALAMEHNPDMWTDAEILLEQKKSLNSGKE